MRTVVIRTALVLAGCSSGGPNPAHPTQGTTTSEPPTPSVTDTGPAGPSPDCAPGVEPTDTLPSFCGKVPTNLIFISIDTFRRDHVDRYGNKGLTPFLGSLAEEGFPLDANAQCSDWTFASTTCTLMGRDNPDAGFIPSLSGPEPVPPGTTFLAGWLAEQGYWSVLVSGNAWLGPEWGNGDGYTMFRTPGGSGLVQGREAAIEELRRAQNRGLADRWFVHLHALEPHIPYIPPPDLMPGLDELEPLPPDIDLDSQAGHYLATGDWPVMTEEERQLLEAHLRVRYEGEIRLLDLRLADAMADFEAEGLLDDTLVVIWSDHGEAFWEHERQSHAWALYGEENDAVAIFWSKNIRTAAWTEPTVSIDLVPTVLTLFGVPLPPEVTGYAIGTAPPDRPRFSMVSARLGQISAVQKDGWRLQFTWATGALSLTRPGEDPSEQTQYQPPGTSAYHEQVLALWPLLEPEIEKAAAALPEAYIAWPEGLR